MNVAMSVNKKVSLNGKNHEDLAVMDANGKDKQKDFENMAIVCRKAGDVFKHSVDFQLDNMTRLVEDLNFETLISWTICENIFCKNITTNDILTDVAKKLPESKTNIACLVSDFFFSSSTYDEKQKSSNKKEILTIFFANLNNQNHIYEAILSNCNFYFGNTNVIEKEGNRFAEELGLMNCNYTKSILLIFGNNDCYFLLTSILKKIKAKVPTNHDMKWIYMFYEQLQVINSDNTFNEITNIMAVRITGPNINCWVESCFYKTSREEFLNKLKELKKRLNLKRHCLGLIFFPKCIFEKAEETPHIRGTLFSNPPDLVNTYKCDHNSHPCCVPKNVHQCISEIFPSIPFMAMFYSSLLCNEETNIRPELEDINSIFIGERGYYAHKYGQVMIITYD